VASDASGVHHPLTCQGQTRREAATQSQGSPRSAAGETARLPATRVSTKSRGEATVKQILARFTSILMVLASLALTLGAGIRWD
jgi:hypothetical protein